MGLFANVRASGDTAQTADLRAEIARLEDEVDRLRLQQAGVHPGGALVEAMRNADVAADTADSSATMYVSALAIRSELAQMLGLLKGAVEDFELRLERLDRGLDRAATALAADESDLETGAGGDGIIDLRDGAARGLDPTSISRSGTDEPRARQ
ncbi:MAG: hypothetical protein ACE367_05620 [Acidimicrobiales bacterium]